MARLIIFLWCIITSAIVYVAFGNFLDNSKSVRTIANLLLEISMSYVIAKKLLQSVFQEHFLIKEFSARGYVVH